MISKFIKNFSLIFFAAISFSSFCIGQDFIDCNLSEEKIRAMESEEIMENFMRCRKNNTIDEKQLTERLQFIEKDSMSNRILQKMMPFDIGISVAAFIGCSYLFYSSIPGSRKKNFSGFGAIGSFLSIGAFWKLNQYQKNRLAFLKESRKKIAAPDIAKIFENMKKNNNG